MKQHLRELAKRAYYIVTGPQMRRRQAYRKSMPYVTLSRGHTDGCTVLPDRGTMLELMQPGGVVMELGVANGDFSVEILKRCRPAKLHLVDAWHTAAYAKDQQYVLDRFSKEAAAGVVEIHRGLSTEVLPRFADGSLDFIYIDTNHSYETTAAELLQAERVVRAGGVIAGHDYCLGNIVKPAVFGVTQAVNEFCVQRNWRFRYITLESNGYFSFCLEKMPARDAGAPRQGG